MWLSLSWVLRSCRGRAGPPDGDWRDPPGYLPAVRGRGEWREGGGREGERRKW